MTYSLVDMLTYCRPEGSPTQAEFCKIYLEPKFGKPDAFGNYVKILGNKPSVCFAAHHDTVHWKSGRQRVQVSGDIVSLPKNSASSCLGADCTTGVWLILEMMEKNIDGVYVVHAAEEIGCHGSGDLVNSEPEWFKHVTSIISLDRFGTESVITHQMGTRTASDEFAVSLSGILELPMLRPDPGGSYTDSNEYRKAIPECTNLSVGYDRQHTKSETQDLWYADVLLERMIGADWSKLIIARDHTTSSDWDYWYETYEYADTGWREKKRKMADPTDDWVNPGDYANKIGEEQDEFERLYDFVQRYPEEISQMLKDWGMSPETLCDDLNINDPAFVNDSLSNQYKKKMN